MKKRFTVTIYTENNIGMMNRVTIIFTRRHLNLDSITASPSEVKGVHRYTAVLEATRDQIMKVRAQIERLTDVLKAFVHDDESVVHQELALYKIRTSSLTNGNVEDLIRKHHARILTVVPEFMVIEKTGHLEETQLLFEELQPYGVLEFARSGRVVITKGMKEFSTYLRELEEKSKQLIN